jgi:hypothetical protein
MTLLGLPETLAAVGQEWTGIQGSMRDWASPKGLRWPEQRVAGRYDPTKILRAIQALAALEQPGER